MADDEPVVITLDGKEIEARPDELVIDAAERNGVYIPRFCYHPRMRPVGMCRMCIVNIDTGRGPALLPSCMVSVAPDMKVDTQAHNVKKAQDGVLEFLLINHPLDCPVCDRGGECPLQDHTMAFGPGESRFIEEKVHFEKPIPISDLVDLDRERCILCDRCTRFAGEVAGDAFISFQDRGAQTQVNTFPDHPFASYFSGNTVQICPVGALLARPYRFRARPWDLEQVESTCQTCAVGCRMAVQSSSNRLVRYLGVDVDPVNWGWLCDRGRFNWEWVDSEDRLPAPMVRDGDSLQPAGWSRALTAARDGIRAALDAGGPGAVGLIGGARLSNEDAYAWAKLAKGVLGTDNVDAQLGDGLPAEVVLGLPRASIDDACKSGGTVILLAPDLKEELPVLFLRLRAAAVEHGARIIEISPRATSLTPYAAASLRYAPGAAGEVVRAVLDGTEAPGNEAAASRRAAELLREAAGGTRGNGHGPVVILGRPSLGESAASVVDAAAGLAGIDGVRFLSALRRGNVHGALDMGLAPGVLPGRVSLDDGREWFSQEWGVLPEQQGLDTTGILTAAAAGEIRALVLLGADPLADFPDHDLARRALAAAPFVLAVDCFLTESSEEADVVLAAAGYAERAGTTTNLEGRVSLLHQKVTPPGTGREDWMIAVDLAYRLGGDLGFDSRDAIWREVERLAPSHRGITRALLQSHDARDGVMVPLDRDSLTGPGTVTGVTEAPEIRAVSAHPTGEIEQAVPAPSDPPEGPAAGAPAGSDEADYGEPSSDDVAAQEAQSAAVERGSGDEAPDGDSPAVSDSDAGEEPEGPKPPGLIRFAPAQERSEAPPVDAYSLRLVVTRKLYDRAVLTQKSPSLAGLGVNGGLRLHPSDYERLGLRGGTRVRVSSARTAMETTAVADPGVPRGSAALTFNAGDGVAGDLIDATVPVAEVRVETVEGAR